MLRLFCCGATPVVVVVVEFRWVGRGEGSGNCVAFVGRWLSRTAGLWIRRR